MHAAKVNLKYLRYFMFIVCIITAFVYLTEYESLYRIFTDDELVLKYARDARIFVAYT